MVVQLKQKETTGERLNRLTGFDVFLYPFCKQGTMPVEELPRMRSPACFMRWPLPSGHKQNTVPFQTCFLMRAGNVLPIVYKTIKSSRLMDQNMPDEKKKQKMEMKWVTKSG